MSGISDPDALLASMRPPLGEETYVFICLPEGDQQDRARYQPMAAMLEDEGLILIHASTPSTCPVATNLR